MPQVKTPPRESGPVRDRILAEAAANPEARNVDIAKAVGSGQTYVSVVLDAAGYRRRLVRCGSGNFETELSPENAKWIEQESRNTGTPVGDLINACVTDARLDDEERAE